MPTLTRTPAGHEPPLMEWEYQPPVGPRPPRGFVGLKNARATCYMNAVLQQVMMLSSFSLLILSPQIGTFCLFVFILGICSVLAKAWECSIPPYFHMPLAC